MSACLHLLRTFTGWRLQFGDRKGEDIATIEDAVAWVGMISDAGFERFCTTTARRPKRLIELPKERWGSVYFTQKKHTIFRMPLKEISDHALDTDILMLPTVFRCERQFVGMVRGWRYLNGAEAPADLPPADAKLPDWYLEGA